jgi:benzodiazapine receptor
MNQSKKNYLSLMIWIVSLLSISSLIGFLAKGNIHDWYQTIQRSPLTPPDHTFGIVWPILYVLIAISGWMIHNKSLRIPNSRRIKIAYGIGLVLNWSWTPLFFNLHWIGGALVCLWMLVVAVLLIIIWCYRHMKIISILLAPYFLWLVFAGYLNSYIWVHN